MHDFTNLNVKFGQKARSALQISCCWALWVLVGTVYYTYDMGTGWVKGFYMAVNVGYSVGWGYPAENTIGSRIFSMLYVLSGIFAVAVSLGYFAQSMISTSKDWYVAALRQEKFKTASFVRRIVLWRKMHAGALRLVALWIMWIAAMVLFTMYTVRWRFTEALYFAVSSLSTGGLWPIPADSPDWYFAVGFTALGVPLMALSMANIAAMFINTGDTDEAQKLIAAEVTLEELHMMQKFDLDDGDGQITRTEYILLCAVRIGALSPDLIEKINERFRALDTSGDGVLSYSEILEVPDMDVSNKPEELGLNSIHYMVKWTEHPYIKPFACWVIWLLFGSIYYAHSMKLGWSKGFYMAVNVGYSIGWGYPSENSNGSRVFSTFYVLIGSSAVAASLGYFAQSMIASSKNWYAKALTEQKFKNASDLEKCIYWAKMNEGALQIIGMWFVWIVSMIIFSLCTVKWNFSQALYFAVSSLSTGGLWAIPSDSPEWYFGVVGVFAATGIPLMALAMANIASMVITVGDPDEAEKIIAAKVTCEELHMMQKFDLDDGDGEISRAEYILLCAVRLGALSPELIDKINDRFKKLDKSGDGALSYAEILEHPEEETVNIIHELKNIAERSPSNRLPGQGITVRQRGYQFIRTLSITSSTKSFTVEDVEDSPCTSSETPQVEMSPVGGSEAPLGGSEAPLERSLSISNLWGSTRAVSKDNIKDSLLGSDPQYSDQP